MSTAAPIDLVDQTAAAWQDANRRYLLAEFARIRTLLLGSRQSTARGGDDEDAVTRARAGLRGEAPIDMVANAFGLSPFERDVLLLTAGVEMEPSLAEACAAHAPGAAGCATFGIALAALPDAHWTALGPGRPLRRWRLVETGERGRLAERPVRIDERVLHHLAGVRLVDDRLAPLIAAHELPELVADTHRTLAARIAEGWEPSSGRWPIVQLHGGDRDGQLDVAALVAAELGWDLRVIRAGDLPTGAVDRERFATLWMRESILLGAALLVDVDEPGHTRSVGQVARALPGPVFLATREPVALDCAARGFTVDPPRPPEQHRLWRAALDRAGLCDPGVEAVAGHLRLSARAIARAAQRLEGDGDRRPTLAAACAAARAAPHRGLHELAQRIEPLATWTDLTVPEPVAAALRSLSAQVRHRNTVYESWGLGATCARGLGITALFAGASGTGKTMAAEVIANDLGLELYRVDLSTVVSKYIGDTEKHLRQIFDAGEDGGAILLFDEADALFGKRSDVKDSHDRYANIEVSYLLQRMEAFSGLAILTTNARAALDRGFQRRIRFVVQFPFPDAALRERIWRSIFPPQTPIEAVDWSGLSELNVAGGTIRSIAVNAAFLAAEAREPVGMHHLSAAARAEQAKRDSGGVLADRGRA